MVLLNPESPLQSCIDLLRGFACVVNRRRSGAALPNASASNAKASVTYHVLLEVMVRRQQNWRFHCQDPPARQAVEAGIGTCSLAMQALDVTSRD